VVEMSRGTRLAWKVLSAAQEGAMEQAKQSACVEAAQMKQSGRVNGSRLRAGLAASVAAACAV
jgi:hypothetical protein